MPDVALLPLAIVGIIVLAGGGGFLARAALGRGKKKDD